MISRKAIGIGITSVILGLGAVASGQNSPPTAIHEQPTTDQGIWEMRQLLRLNAWRALQEMSNVDFSGGDQAFLTDREGNEYSFEEARRMVQGTLLQQQARGEPAADGPRISFTVDEMDFGVVPEKAELVYRFTFKNSGSQPLVIEKVNTGCGCTVAKLAKNEFEPGEVGHLDITYKPKGVGAQKRSIQVLTNDSNLRISTLLLKVDVIPIVAARPTTIQLGNVPLGQTREVVVEIVSRDQDMKILGANVNGPEFSVEVLENAERESLVEPELPGHGMVKVKMLGNSSVGRLLRRLSIDVLASDSDGKPQQNRTINVSIFAQVKGHLTVEPPFIRVKPLQAGEEFGRETILYHDKGESFRIVGDPKILNSNLKDAKVEVEAFEHDGKPAYKIKLIGKAGRVAARFRGKIQLTTDVERQRIIEIDFSGLVRAARAQR